MPRCLHEQVSLWARGLSELFERSMKLWLFSSQAEEAAKLAGLQISLPPTCLWKALSPAVQADEPEESRRQAQQPGQPGENPGGRNTHLTQEAAELGRS